ncbi:polynucleotide adenylyltransferase PcnB [Wenzhouxiangella marina]|uniref:polynucleotide adenylyltransferase PcnB n=1 Tax=Wenzhouxiangella marina TaxID=1579979 RepID=UPI000673A300|nr:polynucleotide adenylyltransferase PcnB [Wenzhouxiangella marina]MBB6086954.1 poly(A) polymerase [Wenzhouxiangella marina]
MTNTQPQAEGHTLRIIEHHEHGIEPRQISGNAIKVVERLQEAGFLAYIVGGSVRDLLLGESPKDFDVATSATPEEVKEVMRNARLIGRRFRLAHVRFGREIIEVATFRGGSEEDDSEHREVEKSGRVLRDNVYGSEEEDARRRDFTINALMYDPSTETIRDHVGGYEDVLERRLRLIGDPVTRYREDPVRLLRAVRFQVKLDLSIEPQTAGPMVSMAPLLADIPPARLFDEILKLFLAGRAWPTYQALVRQNLWEQLFPDLFEDPANPPALVEQTMKNTDGRVQQGLPVTPGFLFAAFLWPKVKPRAEELVAKGVAPVEALAEAGEEAIVAQARKVAIHRRFSTMSKEIWCMQPRFEKRRGNRALRLISERRFRAAYDFLLLRVLEEPELKELADWWTQIQEVEGEDREAMTRNVGGPRKRRRRPRKRKAPASA